MEYSSLESKGNELKDSISSLLSTTNLDTSSVQAVSTTAIVINSLVTTSITSDITSPSSSQSVYGVPNEIPPEVVAQQREEEAYKDQVTRKKLGQNRNIARDC